MESGAHNRAARRSGGERRAAIVVPPLTGDDLKLMAQEDVIRKEFGEEGVKRFWEEVQKKGTVPDAT